MALDTNLLIVAAANVGSVGIIGKYLLQSVEKANESIPVILKAIEAHTKALEELYNSRNDHEQAITAISTTHKIRGCDQPLPPGIHTHQRRNTP